MTIFQSHEWEQFKLATGYQDSFRVNNILVLQKKLPFNQTMLYSPMVDSIQLPASSIQDFTKQIKQLADKTGSIFYRLELAINASKVENYKLTANSYFKSAIEIQPSHTRIIDLRPSEQEILAQMKQKGRYNIKIAERSNLKFEQTKDIKRFFKLYEEMSKRHGISYRSINYFQKLFDILQPKEYIKTFIVSHDNLDLAGAIIVEYQGVATYLFGGSSEQLKNLMAPYLLHWNIIKQSKANGCSMYDLFGVSPEGTTNHKWSGVTAFKEKLGGNYVELAGCFDLPLKSTKYKIAKLLEKVRSR